MFLVMNQLINLNSVRQLADGLSQAARPPTVLNATNCKAAQLVGSLYQKNIEQPSILSEDYIQSDK